ncbi:glycosyltransferase family 2 protein [Haloarcula onubensis]|uniref:Glycosyltransferase family 2 protein n=1 Tax=Haloarcula onubensis TaxID=2950539 RepID=A0ABU2FPF1_9EURY|nr:glycosyltransferase family 2 protein [Halomicroarcula sp. S3CR25-11]MDS0282642.1 glycosyltransferase family 2 protein [Halomicroarcula sp. S3CR25-11]
MYRGKTVGVVLPAYNEAAHIAGVIESLPAYVDRVYAIDDCSTDETFDVISAYAAESDQPVVTVDGTTGEASQRRVRSDGHGGAATQIIPVQHTVNRGAGATLKTGYMLSARDGMDATVTIDADGQMDPDQMSRLLDPLVEGRAGFAKGNRLADASTASGMPPFRLLGNGLLTLLMKPASGYWGLRDPQNGYTAISLDALESIDIEAIPDDHDYPNDQLTRLSAAGVTVADVPMPAIYGEEESTIQFTDFVRQTSATILAAFLWRLHRLVRGGQSHLPALYTAGVVGVLAGVVLAGLVALAGLLPGRLADSWSGAATLLGAGGLALGFALRSDWRNDAGVVRE